MLKHVSDNRPRAGDEGFTLIELMVVVLIMGILAAIAIPTFLSTTKSAKNTAALSNAVNAATSEISLFSTQQSFDSSQYALAQNVDPALPWDTTGAALSGQILVLTTSAWGTAWADGATGTGLIMAMESQPANSTQCYVMIDDQFDATPVVAYFVTTTTCANITSLPNATEPTGGPPASGSASAGAHPGASLPGSWGSWYSTF